TFRNYQEDYIGVYRRDFEKGIVLVNPSTETREVILEHSGFQILPVTEYFTAEGGEYVGVVTIEPGDGVILLADMPEACSLGGVVTEDCYCGEGIIEPDGELMCCRSGSERRSIDPCDTNDDCSDMFDGKKKYICDKPGTCKARCKAVNLGSTRK
ncbi:hypothetical protein KKG41_01950, partial [Patescibacteria group bacterium]|nr:hypothetical protein [Patescibacteria group bacterium]MBU1890783.1 hypothetical protein [Patescibacteria group bacterium]